MRDKLYRKFSKGKSFYTLLILLFAFIAIPLSAALMVCLNALHQAGDAEQAMLSMAMASQIKYSQTISPARMSPVKAENLKSEYTVFSRMGKLDKLNYNFDVEYAERLLRSIDDTDLVDLRSSYLYFKNSDYIMGTEVSGTSARDYANPTALKIIEEIPKLNADYSYNRYGMDKNGDYYAAFVSEIAPDVYFFHLRLYGPNGMPDTYLSDDLLNLLVDYEITYYDSFGDYLPMTKNHTLIQQYDYDSLGNEENGSFSFTYDKHSYLCYYHYNSDNHTKYVLFCKDMIGESQSVAIGFLYFGAICVLVVSLAYALIFARKTYTPLDALVSQLPQDRDDVIRDDYRILSNAFHSMEKKIQVQKRMLSKSCLLRQLRGQSTYGYEDCLPELFAEDNGDEIAVAAVRMDAAENGRFPSNDCFEASVLNRLSQLGYTLYSVWEDDLLLLVFRLIHKNYDELISEVAGLQEKTSNLCVSIYLSNPHRSVHELSRAYSEVRTVAEYCTLTEVFGVLLRYDAIPPAIQDRGSTVPDYMQLKLLSDSCAALIVEDALQQYDALTYQFSARAGRHLKKEDIEFSVLVNTISLAFYNVVLPGDINKKVIKRYVERIKSAQNTAQLRELLKTCLEKFSGMNDSQNSEENRFEQVRVYIEQNFKDHSLCSVSVADRFQTSPSNISRMFKKYNQTGFLEYVHQLRVAEATRLLEETDILIADIALQVGYTNVITMFRAFKTHAHATPGEIRKLYSSENSTGDDLK